MLSTGRESEKRERNDASVMSRLNGLIAGLGLLCSVVPVPDQSISFKAELAEFSAQP